MTTFATSTIQMFTDALIANLNARAGLANTVISDGPPPVPVMEVREWLMIGDVHGNQRWAAIAADRRPKDEEYNIEVLISVVSPTTAGDNKVQSYVNNRCMEIFAELEQELRTNVTQGIGSQLGATEGGYVIVSEIRTPVRLQKRGDDTVREAAMEFGIFVKARL